MATSVLLIVRSWWPRCGSNLKLLSRRCGGSDGQCALPHRDVSGGRPGPWSGPFLTPVWAVPDPGLGRSEVPERARASGWHDCKCTPCQWPLSGSCCLLVRRPLRHLLLRPGLRVSTACSDSPAERWPEHRHKLRHISEFTLARILSRHGEHHCQQSRGCIFCI